MEAFDKFGAHLNLKSITGFTYKQYSLLTFYSNNLIALKTCFMPPKSYSDFSEDILLESIAPNTKLSYVDVGAGHPTIGSNTYYFYKKGFRGITIEPIKFHSKLHELFRRKDEQINGVIHHSKQPIKFYEFNPTQYSTISRDHFNDLLKLGMKPRREYFVNSLDLNSILKLKQYSNYFISIDCEGFDYEILKTLDFKGYNKPFAIILEKSQSKKLQTKVDKFMEIYDFNLRFETVNNLIYSI